MSRPDPNYVFPPNWKPSKRVKCGKWMLPPTLLINGRTSSKLENDGKITSKKGFTCAVCSSYFIGREKANYHVFQKHYRELCQLGGDAIPDDIKPDFSQPTWGKEYLKENMEMSNEDIEKAVNEFKTPSNHEKDDNVVQTPETLGGSVQSSSKSETLADNADENSSRKRKSRCRKCESCLKVDCKSCRACKDRIKYGGPGKLKQVCLMRPNCMNVELKVVKKVKEVKTVPKKTPKKVETPKKLVKVNIKNDNTIKVEKAIIVEDEIPPFKPRIFPLNDEDYNQMMKQETLAGNNDVDGSNDENGNAKMRNRCQDIPTPCWKTNEQKMMASRKDARDYRDVEDITKCRNDTVTMHGDDEDFEDTRDEVYKLRHDRAAAALEKGFLDESWKYQQGKISNKKVNAAKKDGTRGKSWIGEGGMKTEHDKDNDGLEDEFNDESLNDHGDVKIVHDKGNDGLEDEFNDESLNDHGDVKIVHDKGAAAPEEGLHYHESR